MRKVNGYVFIAERQNGTTPLFGRRVDSALGRQYYENIVTNGLLPYNTLSDTKRGMGEFPAEEQEVRRLIPAILYMEMAESAEEVEEFRGLTNLVAVKIVKEGGVTDSVIYGPINPNFPDFHHGVLPAQRIDQNKLLTFKRSVYADRVFDVAMEARFQIQRQSNNAPTLIGTFKLKRLKR